jgi:hypothetical protein
VIGHAARFMDNRAAWPFLLAIGLAGLVIFWCQIDALRYGLNWSDAQTVGYFSGRMARVGELPYRDFVYHAGPMPILIDGMLQSNLGPSLEISNALGMTLNVCVCVILALFATGNAGIPVGCLLAVVLIGLAPQPYHSAYVHVGLAGALVALAWMRRFRTGGNCLAVFGGIGVGLSIWCRPHGGCMLLATVGLSYIVYRLRWPTRNHGWILSFFGGVIASVILCVWLLWNMGILDQAFTESFLHASARKSIGVAMAIWESLAAGTWIPGSSGVLEWLWCAASAVPFFFTVLYFIMMCKENTEHRVRRYIKCVAVLIAIGFLTMPFDTLRSNNLIVYNGFQGVRESQRIIATSLGHYLAWWFVWSCWLLCLVRPRLWVTVHRLDPRCCLVLIPVLAVAGTAQMQVSSIGPDYVCIPGWLNDPLLVALVLVLVGGVRHSGPILGLRLWPGFGILVALGLRILLYMCFSDGLMPGLPDGRHRIFESQDRAYQVGGLNPSKSKLVHWLKSNIDPQESVFVYGVMPPIYRILNVVNPTRIDSIYQDFLTPDDVRQAACDLASRPPLWILVQGAVPIRAVEGKLSRLTGVIVDLLQNYEPVSSFLEIPDQGDYFDMLAPMRLYRRKI